MQKHSIISSFFALIVILSLSACDNFLNFEAPKVGCDLDPCVNVEHSTGVCENDWLVYGQYSCGCEENYFWNWLGSGKSLCVNPCDSKPCGITHSTGECTPSDYDEYECGCEKGSFWNKDELKCGNPCDAKPCGDGQHLRECRPLSKTDFSCYCEEGYYFDGEKCAGLPECSPENVTPCKDSSTWLVWSSKLSENQLNHCLNVSEGGMSDWQWPLIDQLRTLIQNCPNTEPGGECSLVWDGYYIFGHLENCESCEESDTGRYSRFGDTEELRSGTWIDHDHTLYNLVVNFGNGAIEEKENKDAVGIDSRCTRCLEGYFWFEGKCIYSPCNSDPCRDIPHALSECWPESATKYECDCEKGWFWDGSKCVDPCEGVSCDVPDSTGQCIGEKWNKYSCECEKKVWDHSNGRCITVCENNPCDAIPHANGCVPKNDTEYYCSCEDKYYWNGEECLSY